MKNENGREDFYAIAQAELADAVPCGLCTAEQAPHDSDCSRVRARSSALFSDRKRSQKYPATSR